MGMNIWLPIITNAIIAIILVAGIFVGRKNGFKIELAKLCLILPACVGLYFLNPIVVEQLLRIELVSQLIETEIVSLPTLSAITLFIMFMVVYGIISLVMLLFRKGKKKQARAIVGITAQALKPIKLSHKEKRELKKQERKIKKLNKIKTKGQTSRVFGAILGFVFAILVSFAILLPTKFIFRDIAKAEPTISEIEKGFECTPFGQLDKATGVVEFIVKEK